jgi:predicted ATPase/DNA-binding SARP family transcriptional activator
VRIVLLGPLEVCDDGGAPVEVAGGRLRRLLARLALDVRRPVRVEALVDAVWGERPPAGAAHALQSLVSRLRRALPAGRDVRLEALPGGYRLVVPGESVDIGQFERLVAEARAAREVGDLATARRQFEQALCLWRGEPLADVAEADFAVAAAARLVELRLSAIEDRAEVELAIGSPEGLLAELTELTSAHPLRESLRAVQMRALCAAGRPAEALAAFEELRGALADTLGSDPSPALRGLHTAILRGDPELAGVGRSGIQRSPRTNLHTALTSFVGRERELARVGGLLEEGRLVTLAGPGGTGKTRLAVEVARAWVDRMSDGAWLVEVAGVRDPALVADTVLAALGLRETGLLAVRSVAAGSGRGSLDRLVEALRDRQVLIVLDNCEHLVDTCARLAEEVLGGCPGVRILATSREPLSIAGEVLSPVGPLPVPQSTVDIGTAGNYAALRLFGDRAAAVRPGFTLTAENVAVVAQVCRRLDGLPLAIELACARLRTVPLADIAARLGDRFRLLTRGSRTAVRRHQTLQAVVEWSWDLFSEAERTLARRLAVFAGGATLDAAEAVCADEDLPAGDVFELLAALVDKSFVEVIEQERSLPRYRMLDTIRDFAAAELARAGDADRILAAHAGYFLAQAETAEPALRSADQLFSLAWLRREDENLAAALRWAVDSAETSTAVRLVVALGWFWMLRGGHGQVAAWLREALALPGADDPVVVPSGVLTTAYAYDAMYHFDTDPGRSARSAQAARTLIDDETATHPAVAFMTMILDGKLADTGEPTKLTRLAEHRDAWVRAQAELMRGFAAQNRGEEDRAVERFTTARDSFTSVGDRWGTASAASALATSHSLRGDHTPAITAMSEALHLTQALGADDDAAWLRAQRGIERLHDRDLAGAHDDLAQSQAYAHSHRLGVVAALAATGLGKLARRSGDLAAARDLLTGALNALAETGWLEVRIRVLTLTELGRVAIAGGDLSVARAHLDRALEVALAGGEGSVTAGVAEALADLALAGGEPDGAARLLGLAAAARGAPDRGNPDPIATEAAARAALGANYDPAYGSGATLAPPDAVAALRAPFEH